MNTIHEVLVDELQITTMERNYWVDSIAMLRWIQNCRSWKQFVRHRVEQIRELSSTEIQQIYPQGDGMGRTFHKIHFGGKA